MAKKFKLQLGDDMIFDNGENIQKQSFVFTGFGSGINIFHRKMYDWTDEMLKDVGIIVNRAEVSTEDNIGVDIDKGYFEPEDINIIGDLQKSLDGNIYYCIYNVDMGRGWCVLMKIQPNGKKSIIKQDHRDNVREWMIDEWCKENGVDVEINYK